MSNNNETPTITDLVVETNRATRNAQTAYPESASIEEPATPNDWKVITEAQNAKIAELERIIAAGRIGEHPSSPKDGRPAMTADKLRALWGDKRYLHGSTEAEKLTAIGVEPTVDRGLLLTLFGKASEGNDGKAAQELMKANPARYRLLREAARVLRIA